MSDLIGELREVARSSVEGTQVLGSPIMRGGDLAARAADAIEAAEAKLARVEALHHVHYFNGVRSMWCECGLDIRRCETVAALGLTDEGGERK